MGVQILLLTRTIGCKVGYLPMLYVLEGVGEKAECLGEVDDLI